MKLFVSFCFLMFACANALAADMHFEFGGSPARCPDCGWIQATGEITANTPRAFDQFIARLKIYPKVLRINSPGGNVRAGIALGQKLRAKGFATQVGADSPIPGAMSFGEGRASEKRPGHCLSACAYAFLGGIERSFNGPTQFGVHRFFSRRTLKGPDAQQFTAADIDNTQRLSADLLRYMIQMGVDPRLLALASEAGAGDIRWITGAEARDLRIVYEPEAWKPWRVETYRGGAIAISETNDGKIKMVASCSGNQGAQVVLTDQTQPDESLFKRDRTCPVRGKHPVFGTFVDQSQVEVFKPESGGAGIRFRLPTKNLPLTSPAIFGQFNENYRVSCTTKRYEGTTENFAPAVNLAFRNCTNEK